ISPRPRRVTRRRSKRNDTRIVEVAWLSSPLPPTPQGEERVTRSVSPPLTPWERNRAKRRALRPSSRPTHPSHWALFRLGFRRKGPRQPLGRHLAVGLENRYTIRVILSGNSNERASGPKSRPCLRPPSR